MFTRKELIEYFSDAYTEEQVVRALGAIAKYDKSVNPDGDTFEDTITEQLEGAFEVTEKVIITSPSLSISQAKEAAVMDAVRNHPELDTRIFEELIYIVSERAIARAATLRRIEDGVFDAATAQLDAEALEGLRDKNERLIRAYQLIGNNDERINKILAEYGVNNQLETIDFLEQVYQQPDEDEFDPQQWLTDLQSLEESPTKKLGAVRLPTALSKAQSRILVRHIFNQSRKAG